MFNTKKAQPPIRTLIGEGSVLQGEIRFTDGLRIDGESRRIARDGEPGIHERSPTRNNAAET